MRNKVEAISPSSTVHADLRGEPTPSLTLTVTGIQTGDILMADVLGAPTQPNAPWSGPDDSWVRYDQVLHLGRFWHLAPQDEASASYTFTPDPSVASKMNDAAGCITIYRAAQAVAGSAGWPICESFPDAAGVCNGKDGNVPNPNCPGCHDWAAPSVTIPVRGSIIHAAYAGHNEAYPVSPPAGFTQLYSVEQGKLTLLVCQKTVGPKATQPFTAVPGGTGWEHGIATVAVLIPL